MQLDFNTVRNAGIKMTPRFTYTVTSNSDGCDEGFICLSYADASKVIVLAQIQQLGEVLTTNSDVITALQMFYWNLE